MCWLSQSYCMSTNFCYRRCFYRFPRAVFLDIDEISNCLFLKCVTVFHVGEDCSGKPSKQSPLPQVFQLERQQFQVQTKINHLQTHPDTLYICSPAKVCMYNDLIMTVSLNSGQGAHDQVLQHLRQVIVGSVMQHFNILSGIVVLQCN